MINATLKRYQEKFPHYLEFFEILQQIHLLRKTHNKLWSKDIFSFDRRMAARKLAANKPLINLQHDPFDDEMPRHYFLDLLTVAENTHPDAVENLRKTISTDITTYTEMVRKLFSKTEKSSTGAPASTDKPEEYFDLITFFLHQSLKPFFSQLALKSKDLFEKQMWTQGVCPICSQTPDLSLLRNEEGNRSLFCLQCDFEWPYKRLQCHYCGNEDQRLLSYFTVEGPDQDRYRVNVCNHCQRFIKTIDTRKMNQEIDLEIENLITIHLDLEAAKEGFH